MLGKSLHIHNRALSKQAQQKQLAFGHSHIHDEIKLEVVIS